MGLSAQARKEVESLTMSELLGLLATRIPAGEEFWTDFDLEECQRALRGTTALLQERDDLLRSAAEDHGALDPAGLARLLARALEVRNPEAQHGADPMIEGPMLLFRIPRLSMQQGRPWSIRTWEAGWSAGPNATITVHLERQPGADF